MDVLITGVSSGIGRALTKVYIENGHRVLGVARRTDKLEELKSIYKDSFDYISWDLTRIEELEGLVKQIDSKNMDIDLVINNAGLGSHGEFWSIGIKEELKMIDLNIKSLTYLSKVYLKKFREKNRGGLINVASTASFQEGGPLMATYYGTKSYVLSLDEGLRGELEGVRDRSIRVMTLCPGPTSTEFVGMNPKGKLPFYITTPEDVARECYRDYLNKKEISIPGIFNKFLNIIGKFIPRKIERKIIYRIQKKKRS